MAKKISPKLQQAAEKYLTSLSSSRDQLTDKQWEVFVNHVKCEQIFKWLIPFFILPLAIFFTCLTVLSFKRSNELVNLAVPDEVVYVNRDSDESPILVEPEHIKTYLERLKKLSFHSAAGLVNSTLLFMVVILRLILGKHRAKVIQALVEHKKQKEPPQDRLKSQG